MHLPKRTAGRSRLPGGTLAPLPEHPDQHRPEGPILLAVDQQVGEGATLRVAPELADPVGAVEVGEHQDVEQLGAWSQAEASRRSPRRGASSSVHDPGNIVPEWRQERQQAGMPLI